MVGKIKHMKYKLLSYCLVFSLLNQVVMAQTIAKGYVYADSNKNNKRDKKEKGIPGVAVSNGIQVVQTNSSGYYEIPISDDQLVFVIKPSEYSCPVNEFNQPQFFFNHKPAGSPAGFKYKGVEPTGPLPAFVDFPLLPQIATDTFTTLLFGDPQPYTEKEVEYFARGVVAELEGSKDALFGLSLGDLVGDHLDLHNPYIKAVQKVGIPWYNLMGNHDMNYDATADSLADETFERNFGPANYAFNVGKAHFIILDDILYPDPRDQKGYWGGFRASQLEFIENDLRTVPSDRLIVLAFHIPLKNSEEAFRSADRRRLFELLKNYPNTLSLSAHTHLQRNDFFGKEDGFERAKPHHEFNAGTTSGDWYKGELNEAGIPVSTMRDGTPKGYAFLRITGNQYLIDYKVAGKPASYQMEIAAPKVIPFKQRTSAGIHVNFFMGHRGSLVECRINGGAWKKMNYVEDADPVYLQAVFKWDLSDTLLNGKRPSNPEKSTHLFRIDFPTDLPEGTHQIEIRATDMFGRVFTAQRDFRVEKTTE
jgi:hypothetical protein